MRFAARLHARSATTHNLGYDEAERERYPWVAELSASDDEYAVLRTRRATYTSPAKY